MRYFLIVILLFSFLTFSQTINISGKVTNSSGSPISGAVIKIFNTPLACTSKTDGTYLLSGSTNTFLVGNLIQPLSYSLNYKNGVFTFYGPPNMPASAMLYDLRGRMVAKVFSGILSAGNAKICFSINGLGHSLLVLRVTINNNVVATSLISTASDHFNISGTIKTPSSLSKRAAVDWLQATKTGYASHSQPIDSYVGVINITLNALSATEPNFGPNTKIFDPTMSSTSIQSVCDQVHNSSSQFATMRAALFFKPGNYNVNVRVRYYIQAYGLGFLPTDVQVTGAVEATEDGTGSFWRGVEGFTVTPSGGTSVWAVSQADPFRRMWVKGAMSLCNSGASGGFISDSKIDGSINTNCGQQFYIRNSILSGVNAGGMWNLLIQVCDNPPAENYPTDGITVVAKTPLVREKPYIVYDNNAKTYSVFVPALRRDCQGTTWYNKTPEGEFIPIDLFYIAIAGTDNASTINAALAQGKNLILTPGIYQINTPIVVQRPNTIVLGLGMATLQATNNAIALKTADADGIIIANVLLEPGAGVNSPVLFVAGDSGSTIRHADNPPFVFDLFIRSGGAVDGKCVVGAIFNSNDLVLDHCWIWRADHGTGSGWISDTSTIRDGLVINSNNCITYGQMVEHWQKYNTLWRGNNGRQYFYQHEFNYDVPSQPWFMEGNVPGKPAIKVADGVTNYEGWAIGIYSYFRQAAITVTNAMVVPRLSGIKVHHIITFSLGSDKGTILHAINDTGPAAKWGVTPMIRFGEYVGH